MILALFPLCEVCDCNPPNFKLRNRILNRTWCLWTSQSVHTNSDIWIIYYFESDLIRADGDDFQGWIRRSDCSKCVMRRLKFDYDLGQSCWWAVRVVDQGAIRKGRLMAQKFYLYQIISTNCSAKCYTLLLAAIWNLVCQLLSKNDAHGWFR